MKFVPLIIRNLSEAIARRTILSVLSIAVSTLIFAALMSVPAVAARILRDSRECPASHLRQQGRVQLPPARRLRPTPFAVCRMSAPMTGLPSS